MDTSWVEGIRHSLQRAGLKPVQTEIDDLASFLEEYQERLAQLHAIDVEGDEVAGTFTALSDQEG